MSEPTKGRIEFNDANYHELRRDAGKLQGLNQRQAQRIAELEAEVAELRQDKVRLDWLDSEDGLVPMKLPYQTEPPSPKRTWGVRRCGFPISNGHESVRAAIDAAMRKETR